MPKIDSPDTLAALALVPEQLPAYVRGVAGSELRFASGFAVYLAGADAVVAGHPTADEQDLERFASENSELAPDPELDKAIAEVSGWKGLERITVLAATRPISAPVGAEGYSETRDSYLALDLPYFTPGESFSGLPGQKLRNMLRRAARDVDIATEPWGSECQTLARAYTSSRVLEAGTRYIFEHLEAYASSASVTVFTARLRSDSSLQGLCIGDYTPFATAFYMFAFRQKSAVPGTADLLLYSMVEEAQRQGHERVNLGLAINGGIGFFKEKWGARHFMPQVECSWSLLKQKKSFIKSLFG